MWVQEGDVIKFGRVRFRVKVIVVDQGDIKEEEPVRSPNKREGSHQENEFQQSGVIINDTMLMSEAQ